MIHYILQIIAFQLFFLLIYDIFLKKETFFNWNRSYLLITSLLSFILPSIKIKALQESIPQAFIINLPEVVVTNNNSETVNSILLDTIYITDTSVSYIEWIFYIGFGVSILLFTLKLLKIRKLIYGNPKVNKEGFRLVNLGKSTAAFSFLNYIFIGEKIDQKEAAQILEHEKIHVIQKHTLDLLYFEVLRILFWFNPLIYIYQTRIATLHEYIADAKAVKEQSKSHYYQNLLSQIFDTNKVSFINTFFKQSLIKKRIIMLSKQKSKQILKLKYALLIPVVFGMLIYTSCSQANATITDLNESELINKIAAMKTQVAIQGNISTHEDKGFEMLVRVIKGDEIDQSLIKEVHAYEATKGESKLTEKIADVFKQIQIQGNISDEEEKVLKEFLILVSPNGLNDPFYQDVIETAKIPFGVIEQIPLLPGCENLSKEEQKKCMSQKVSKHVAKNFNTKLGDIKKLKGKQKIYVHFVISNKGEIKEVKARAVHKILEEEAERVIKLLPKMKPGTHEGKAVNVPYSLPIVFQINE